MRTRWPRPVRLFGTNDRLARPGHEAVHGGRPRNQVSKELRQPQDQSSSPAAYIEVSSDRRERPSNHEGVRSDRPYAAFFSPKRFLIHLSNSVSTPVRRMMMYCWMIEMMFDHTE